VTAAKIQKAPHNRVVVWFSCGATSAVAGKLAIEKYKNKIPVVCAYADTGAEHPDNERFLSDCENWYGQKILRLKSDRYRDIWDVFERTRYLVGIGGARCTTELKKSVRHAFENAATDIQVFGFDASETDRAERFKDNNPDCCVETPLIEHGISKQECFHALNGAGIGLPKMYLLGYRNNNCIGCVKGQSGYWNKVRIDFPDVFARMAKVERELNVAINKSYAGDGKRKRVFLDELDPKAGRYESELPISCGLMCDPISEVTNA
jgi:hypothetical protein